MAGSAQISSSFVITFVPSDSAATTITNPGRTFKIVGVSANNTTGNAHTFALTDGTSALVVGNYSCGANGTTWCQLTATDALLDISAVENLVATCSNVGLSPVHIHCVATGGGESLTAT